MKTIFDKPPIYKPHPDALNEIGRKILECVNIPNQNGWLQYKQTLKTKQDIVLEYYLQQVGVLEAYILYENCIDSAKRLQIIPTSFIEYPSHPSIIVEKIDDTKPVSINNIKEAKLGLYF